MKVLHVLNEIKPSGAEVMLRSAATTWREGGLELHVLSTGEKPGDYAQQLGDSGFVIHHIEYRPEWAFFVKLFRLLRRCRFDVVHIHTERANFYYGVVSWLARTKRIVRTVHSVFRFSNGLRTERIVQRGVLRFLGIKHVSIGRSVEQNEARLFKNPTTRIPNWYPRPIGDSSPADRHSIRRQLGIEDNVCVLLSVGNCAPVKNHEAIIRALPQLITDTRCLYIHIGEEDEIASDRSLVEELGLETCVLFEGFVDDIRPYLKAADVFVMPSLYEGFSIAAVEATAAGCPAVLADVQGLRDLKEYCRHVEWVDPTPADIVRGVRRLLAIPDHERRARATCDSEAVRKLFSPLIGSTAYASLYREIDS
jgi:glycosyltransferase involved in cell wall biosynthesis